MQADSNLVIYTLVKRQGSSNSCNTLLYLIHLVLFRICVLESLIRDHCLVSKVNDSTGFTLSSLLIFFSTIFTFFCKQLNQTFG